MTVTVGFLCHDGVVLGADSQESYEGSALKRSVPKLVILPPVEDDKEEDPPDRRVIFTGAGDSSLVDKLIDETWLEAALANPTVVDIASAIERRIIELHQQYEKVYHPGYMPNAQLTYGIWCAKETRLFHSNGPVVNEVGKLTGSLLPGRASGYKATGTGNVITDYIQERMRARPHSVTDAIVLTAYMLEQAVLYGEGCGGDVRIACLQNSGKTTKVNLDQYTTSILRELDDQISQAVLAAANPRTDDKIMELLWDRAKKRLMSPVAFPFGNLPAP
jgi:hypothetical protein